MLKHKLSLSSSWLPIMLVSFIPQIGHCDPKSVADLQTTSTAQTALVGDSGGPGAAPASTAAAPGEIKGILTLDQAKTPLSLSIVAVPNNIGQTVYALEGWVPEACKGDIEIQSRDTNPHMTDGGTVGWGIHDNGQLLSCVSKYNCNDEETTCLKISTLKNSQLVVDSSSHTHLSYFDCKKMDMGACAHEDIPGSVVDIKSSDEIKAAYQKTENDRIARQEKALRDNIISCARSADGLDTARAMVAGLTDQADKDNVMSVINEQSKKYKSRAVKDQDAAITKLEKQLNGAKFKLSDIADDGLDDKVFEISDALGTMHDADPQEINDKDYTKLEDRLAGIVLKMVDLNVTDDDANADSIQTAKDLLSRALGSGSHDKDDDDDSDSDGLTPSKKLRAQLQATRDYDLPRAEVSKADMLCDADQLKGSRSATRDCEKSAKLMKSESESLQKEYKKMKCVDKDGLPNAKRDKNDDLDKACSEIEDEAQALAEVPATDQQAIQTQYAALAKRMQTQQGGTAGQNALANLVMPGSPSSPTFTSMGLPVMGGGGLGVNPGVMIGNNMLPGMSNQFTGLNSGIYNGYMMGNVGGSMPRGGF